MARLSVQMLGGFQIEYEGREVSALRSGRLTLLLSYLALHADTPISRKLLAFTFWADTTEEQARTNLRNLFHHIRKAFPEFDSFFEIKGQSIQLRSDATIRLDVTEFKSALEGAKNANDKSEQMESLKRAVSFYRGELLPGYYEEWILAYREEIHQSHLAALSQLAKMLEDLRQYDEAIEITSRIIRSEPLNEMAYHHAMRLHALNDNRAGALQIYHTCSKVLMRELGVGPSPGIMRLHEQLVQSGEMSEGESMWNQSRETYRLIGRNQEWGRLREAWFSIQRGKAGMVIILGEAGIGKSRLADELMQWVRRQGVKSAFAQCYPMENTLSFAPVLGWLRTPDIQSELGTLEPMWKKELGRLLPDFEAQAGEFGGKKWQKQRLFEAVAKGLLGLGKPQLLVLDDMQWGDLETLEFVQYLMRYAARSPLMILATARAEELGANHPLLQLRLTLQSRGQLDEIELSPLSKTDLGLLAREVTGADLSETKREELFAETEGNPFFIVEILRSSEALEVGGIPQSLRTVLNQRLEQLSTSARELAGLASAIGREFGYSLLARSSSMSENTLMQALDELWARRIVQAREDGGYAFTHGKLSDAAYETPTLPRRQMFHRRIAGALLEEADTQAALVARHYEMCGEFQKAFEYHLLAAESSRRIFANHDAISHLEKALELLSSRLGDENSEYARKGFEARERLGDLYDLREEGEKAVVIYSDALEKADFLDYLTRIRVQGKIATITAHKIEYEKGIRLFDEVLASMSKTPNDEDRAWLDVWSKIQFDRVWAHYNANDVMRTQQALEAVRPVVEHLGEREKLGEYYFLIPTLYFRRNGYQMNDEIMRYSTMAMEIGQQSQNLELRTRTFFGYGFCNFLLGNFEPAIQYFGDGLKLAEHIGYVEQQTFCLTYLAAAHRCAGHVEKCKSLAEQALALCERENAKSFSSTALANLGWVAWKQGDLQRARGLSRKALAGWSRQYPFWWYGLWTLIDISLASRNVEAAAEYARLLRAPGQQIFDREVDGLLAEAIKATDKSEIEKCKSMLEQAVNWAKDNRFL